MRRTNKFVVAPQSRADEECLRRLLDASASLWNELTYRRRQQFFDGQDIWEQPECCDRYKSVLGAATVQTVRRVSDETWRSFFELRKDQSANPPGYWGNTEEGRDLKVFLRNNTYTVQWGARSRVELLIGQDLKREFGLGYYERLRLDIRGDPNWEVYEKQGRLKLQYDEVADLFRAVQPVTISDSKQATSSGDESAALDIGANNLVACATTAGQRYLYDGQALFERFRETTQEIARLQSLLQDGQHSSRRIQRLYQRRARRRDHARDALARDLIERLHDDGVSRVYVGDLTDVLTTHRSGRANEKTHNFWAFRSLIDRLEWTAEEYSITVKERSEAWTSQICPRCGSTDRTVRDGESLTCSCGFDGHADLSASESFLKQQTDIVRPMARPVCLTWDDHRWSESPRSRRPSEEHTNP